MCFLKGMCLNDIKTFHSAVGTRKLYRIRMKMLFLKENDFARLTLENDLRGLVDAVENLLVLLVSLVTYRIVISQPVAIQHRITCSIPSKPRGHNQESLAWLQSFCPFCNNMPHLTSRYSTQTVRAHCSGTCAPCSLLLVSVRWPPV